MDVRVMTMRSVEVPQTRPLQRDIFQVRAVASEANLNHQNQRFTLLFAVRLCRWRCGAVTALAMQIPNGVTLLFAVYPAAAILRLSAEPLRLDHPALLRAALRPLAPAFLFDGSAASGLGLAQGGGARRLGVDERTSRRWALGERDIPPRAQPSWAT